MTAAGTPRFADPTGRRGREDRPPQTRAGTASWPACVLWGEEKEGGGEFGKGGQGEQGKERMGRRCNNERRRRKGGKEVENDREGKEERDDKERDGGGKEKEGRDDKRLKISVGS